MAQRHTKQYQMDFVARILMWMLFARTQLHRDRNEWRTKRASINELLFTASKLTRLCWRWWKHLLNAKHHYHHRHANEDAATKDKRLMEKMHSEDIGGILIALLFPELVERPPNMRTHEDVLP